MCALMNLFVFSIGARTSFIGYNPIAARGGPKGAPHPTPPHLYLSTLYQKLFNLILGNAG